MSFKTRLIAYCEHYGVKVPSQPTIEYLVRAVSLHFLDGKRVWVKQCFGLRAQDNPNCIMCDVEKQCFKSTIGLEKTDYIKKINKL